MARIARLKPPESIYHVMGRSISELTLFPQDDDKRYFLALLKKYCDKFHCTILAYCLMDTHFHLHFDPQGFDLSRFMHCTNLSYVLYYNKKYHRRGHLFQGRFESRVITSDSYNLAVSTYIHNNPADIPAYQGKEAEYPFSSLGIYLGCRRDTLGLVDTDYILGLLNERDRGRAVTEYRKFVNRQKDTVTEQDMKQCLKRFASNEYRCERKMLYRDYTPSQVACYVAHKLNLPVEEMIKIKSSRFTSGVRAFYAFILRAVCSFTYRDICEVIGNISLSASSRLCRLGYELVYSNPSYREIFQDILQMGKAA